MTPDQARSQAGGNAGNFHPIPKSCIKNVQVNQASDV